MEQLAAKKLGEAVALCGMGAEMIEKHKDILMGAMEESDLEKKREVFLDHTERSRKLGEELGQGEVVAQATEEARQKFGEMHETFMGDDMDNPLKAVSWMGLAAAGGLAIWAILDELSHELDNEELDTLSEEATEFQKQNLLDGELALRKLAKEQAGD